MAEQDRFAALHLDTEQGTQFRKLCEQVRRCQISGQPLLDKIVAIF